MRRRQLLSRATRRYEQSQREHGPRAAAAAAAREREAFHAAQAAGAPPATAPTQPSAAPAPTARSAADVASISQGRSVEQLTVALQKECAKLQQICDGAKAGGTRAATEVLSQALLAAKEAVARVQAAAVLSTAKAAAAAPLATAPDALASNSTKRMRSALESGGGRKRQKAAAVAAEAGAAGDSDSEEDAPVPEAQPLQMVYKAPQQRRIGCQPGAGRSAGDGGRAPPAPAAAGNSSQHPAVVTRAVPPPTAEQLAKWPAHEQRCHTPAHGPVEGRPWLTFAAGIELAACPDCGKQWPRIRHPAPPARPQAALELQGAGGGGTLGSW